VGIGIESGKAWLTPPEQKAAERLAGLRLIFEGKHRKYFWDQARTQHLYKALGPNARNVLYITENLPGRCTLKYADLLFGEGLVVEPEGGAEATRAAVRRLAETSRLQPLCYEAAATASWGGRAWWNVRVRAGAVRIRPVAPEHVFPRFDADGDLAAALLKWPAEIGGVPYARVLEVEPGVLRHSLWRLKAGTDLVEGPADLAALLPGLAPEERTGIDELALIDVPNFSTGGPGESDYDDECLTLVDEVNNRRSQISRVLDVHGDPVVQALESLFDAQGNLKLGGRAVVVDDPTKDAIKYVTWEAKLEAAAAALDSATRAYLGHMEIAPVLVGLGGDTSADSWKKLKLAAMQTIARVKRKRLWMAPAIEAVFRVAQKLENAWAPGVSYPVAPVTLTWSDGLPVDDEELMRTVTGYRAAGLMSRRQALLWIHADPEIVAQELAALQEEDEASLPTAFRGGRLAEGAAGPEGA
jgi:hypothetical protein